MKRWHGSGTAGAFVAGTDELSEASHLTPARDNFDAMMAAAMQKNVYAGGSFEFGITAEATGDVDLRPALPIVVDNRGSRISGFTDSQGAVLKVQFRFYVRVSNAAITVTPKVYDIDAPGAATVSGAATSSGIATDYSGTNQVQVVALTLPTAKHSFKPQLTIGGTPATGYEVFGLAMFDLYVEMP